MPTFQFVGQMSAGFGEDFNAALDQLLLLPVGLEAIERHAFCHAADSLDRLDDVGQARDEEAGNH